MASSSWLTRSYNFVDKDPQVDVWRGVWRTLRIKESDFAVLAGLSPSTIKNMFGGKTRRPQFSTFAKMAGAVGKRYELVDDHEIDFAKAIPVARAEYKAHKAALKKQRERASKRKNGKGK